MPKLYSAICIFFVIIEKCIVKCNRLQAVVNGRCSTHWLQKSSSMSLDDMAGRANGPSQPGDGYMCLSPFTSICCGPSSVVHRSFALWQMRLHFCLQRLSSPGENTGTGSGSILIAMIFAPF